MPLDHHLPATYIASFSLDRNPHRRERRLWVGDKQTGRTFETSAANVGAIRNFYDDGPTLWSAEGLVNHRIVDRHFSFYEGNLANAIQRLISGTLDAMTWLSVLVRFVAGLLVRGPDFNLRFIRRFGELPNDPTLRASITRVTSRANINTARLIEDQRLMTPICVAQWHVFETSASFEQITNDVGFVGYQGIQAHKLGMAVALDQNHVLVLIPQLRAFVATPRAGIWVPAVTYSRLPDQDHMSFINTVGRTAHRFVFGPTERAVRPHVIKCEMPTLVPDPPEMGFRWVRDTELAWAHLYSLFANPPSNPNTKVYLDITTNRQNIGYVTPLPQ